MFCKIHVTSSDMINVNTRWCAHAGGCTTLPAWNFPGEKRGLYCKVHAIDGMLDIVNPRCQHPGCNKQPSYNMPHEVRGLFCKVHVTCSDMTNVVSRRCAHAGGCTTRPNWNFPGEKRGLYCAVHALDGMLDIASPRCQHPGCKSNSPAYNAPSEKQGKFCAVHAGPDMVDVLHKKCAHPGCGKIPKYNVPGQKCGLFCVVHKSDAMVRVHAKLCDFPTCGTRPTYGVSGQKHATRCAVHRDDIMVDVKSRRCAFVGCGAVQPGYGNPGGKSGSHCFAHKTRTMVLVRHLGCKQSKECMRKPYYAEPDEASAKMCGVHRSKTMVSIESKRCQTPKCKRDAEFGKTEVNRAQFCIDHKPDGYVDVYAARRCEHAGCTADWDLTYETTEGAVKQHKACLAHAPAGYEEEIKRFCKYCDVREDVEFVCASCKLRMHKKEHAVVRHLRRTIKLPFKYDESPGFECTRKRPDIRFEMPTHDVIVEVDENQHRGYAESCECARIAEIVGAIGGKAVVFIRYNPDAVKFAGKPHKVTAAERIDLLVATVNEEIAREITKFEVRLVQLWFDAETAEAKRETDITSIVAV